MKPKAKRASNKNNIIVEDVKPVIEETIHPVEEPPVEEVKPKAKRASKNNNIIIEDIKPVIEEVENIKTLELVQCEKCNKQMTKTTLRYHHKCPGQPVDKKYQ